MGDYKRGTRVYVGGLVEGTKKEDLENEFEKFGKLNSVWVAFNPPGFAFVEFSDRVDAEAACERLNDTDLLGAKLRVEISRGRGRGRGGGRSYRGGGGGFRGGMRNGGGSYTGGRGGGRYDDYGRGRSGDFGGRDSGYGGGGYGGGRGSRGGYRGSRDSGRDSYGGGGSDYYGGGRDSGASRFRSRSPVGRSRY